MRILPADARLDPTTDRDLFMSGISSITRALEKRIGAGRTISGNILGYSARLIDGIGVNAGGLVEFLSLWKKLIDMPLPKAGPDHRIPKGELSKFDEKNTEMIEAL